MKLTHYVSALLFLFARLQANSQELQTAHFTTNNSVNKILKVGNTTYLAGNFSSVGYGVGNSVELDKSTGVATNRNFPATDNYIRVTISDGAGGWYIGGEFTKVGSESRRYLAHFFADGSLDPWNPSPDYYVQELKIDDDVLYVGGGFNNIAGQARKGLASFNASTGAITGFNPTVAGTVFAVVASGTDLFIAGSFNTVNGVTRNNIAGINKTTAAVSTFNPNANSFIRTLTEAGGVLYAGGNFSNIGGQSRSFLAALNKTSGLATSWNPGVNGSVYRLDANSTDIYVTGLYTIAGGQNRKNLAAISLSTGATTAWNPNVDGFIYGLLLNGNTVFVGIEGGSIGGAYRTGVAEINLSDGLATSFNPCLGGSVFGIAMSGTRVFAGGLFSTVNGAVRRGLAAFDVNGNLLPLDIAVNGQVSAMVVNDNILYLGGQFYEVAGQTRQGLAAIDLSTGTLTSWSPLVSGGSVNALAVSPSANTMFVGGSFFAVGGGSSRYLSALSLTTGVANAWTPQVTGGMNGIKSLMLAGGKLFAGGDFTMAGGAARRRLVSFDESTLVMDSWAPELSGAVESMAANGDELYIGGSFNTINTLARPRLAKFSISTGTLSAWSPAPNNQVGSLTTDDGKLYAGGYFTSVSGETRNSIAVFELSSGTLESWAPLAGGSVNAIAVSNGMILLGGQYINVNDGYRSLAAFGTAILLPVRWLSFTGQAQYDHSILSWLAGQDLNTSKFNVERSIDGTGFKTIGTLAANNHTGAQSYQYTDHDFKALKATKVYYRIAQHDIDGKMSYSKVISLGKASQINAGIYPNPVQGNSRLGFQLSNAEQVTISVVNSTGITVKQFVVKAQPGQNNVELNLNNLTAGVYLLNIAGTSVNEQLRFVK